ncbi:PilN domain-containing protein [Baekduia sp. Peel2402]|uniref:PilN domain-containing protein n=1 Tax=Baekduia sp. Peel2402 TaxID=3458296 RepID=UPI00403EBED7
MRAVNLIPTDQQRGAGGAAGKSGGGAYALLGGLALLVVLAATYVVTNTSVSDKTTELANVTQQAEAAEAKAQQLTSYTKFASIRQKRVDTVTQLADSRFDWAHALREVARVLPENAWLTSMSGTTSTSVTLTGGASGSLRSALNVPAIVIQGCTTSQSSVAKLISRLRLVDGVQRVTLEDSTKGQEQAAGTGTSSGAATSASTGDCRGGHAKFPIFNVDVFFEQGTTVATGTTGAAAGASSTTPASTTSSTASSTVPASGTTGGTSK